MLKGASLALAARSQVFTSVARTSESLQSLHAALDGFAGVHHMLTLDWSNTPEFLSGLARHTAHVGHPSLVVAWLHDERLLPAVISCVAPRRGSCRFFHVRGSSAADPSQTSALSADTRALRAGVNLHQVILGFHVSGEGSRWLTHAEISAGVLSATERQEDMVTVGTTSPWARRPGVAPSSL